MTPEHKTFFGFSRTPFTHGKDEKPWLDTTREKALERLKLLTLNPGFAVLHGPPGCGKTRLLQHFVRSLNTNMHQSVYIANSNLNDSGLLQLICAMHAPPPSSSSTSSSTPRPKPLRPCVCWQSLTSEPDRNSPSSSPGQTISSACWG